MSKHRHLDLTFPVMLYKSPGDQQGPDGTTYRYKTVDSQADLDAHLDAGFHLSVPEACGVKEPEPDPAPVNQLAIDTAAMEALGVAPSRPELEREAKDLGITNTQPLQDGELEQLIGERLVDQQDVSDSPSGTEEDQRRREAEKGRGSKKAKV